MNNEEIQRLREELQGYVNLHRAAVYARKDLSGRDADEKIKDFKNTARGIDIAYKRACQIFGVDYEPIKSKLEDVE